MFDLFYTENKYVPERFKKVFEIECSTYKILAKKREFVWVVYRRVLTNAITGLYLFDTFDKTGKVEPLLMEDMLKIFIAYQALCTDGFAQKSTRIRNRCDAILMVSEQEIEKQMNDIQAVKSTVPDFVYSELVKVIALMWLITDEEKKIYNILAKYNKFVNQESVAKEALPARLFTNFYLDLYHCQEIETEILKHKHQLSLLSDRVEDFLSVLPKQESADVIRLAAQYQQDKTDEFFFYRQFPAMKKIIESEFSDNLIAPYKKLIRNE